MQKRTTKHGTLIISDWDLRRTLAVAAVAFITGLALGHVWSAAQWADALIHKW